MLIEKLETGYLKENCYVLSINNNCLIIDPGANPEKIISLVGDKRVLAILITHYHFDHVGALDELKKFYDTVIVDYKNKINKIGDFSFDIIDTKGHKEDSVTYYFKKEKVMFVGDFIFKGTIGRCDLEGGNVEEMMRSLNKIKTYDKDIKIYPGHGECTTLGEELKHNLYMKGDFYE